MDFNSLLQQAERLTNDVDIDSEFPRVERTISQVLQATHELNSRGNQTGAQDVQAHILLGSRGIDLPQIQQKLEKINTRSGFDSLEPTADADIESFLKNERENSIISIIEQCHKRSQEEARKQTWEHIHKEWQNEKVKIMNALIGPSHNFIDITKIPEQTILNEKTNKYSKMDNVEMTYATEIAGYNSIIIKGGSRPNLIQKFARIAKTFLDQKVDDMYEIMKYMVNVTPFSRTRDPIESRVLTKEFIIQAKKYLEDRYKQYMNTIITANLREAQRGGVPGIYNMVSAFVGLKFNATNSIGLMDACIDGKPLWPMVYFCLRCGDKQGALRCLEIAGGGHEDLTRILDEKIKKPEHDVSQNIEHTLKLHYCNKIKNATDPFKKAVYCIIGGFEVNEQHSEVAKTIDDFLWLKLSLLQYNDNLSQEHLGSDLLTYANLQTEILEKYGEKYFKAQEQRHLYFQVLALTGQFEAAIEFLGRTDRYRAHAVHMAIALNEMYMIGLPRDVSGPMLIVDVEDPIPMRRLNIARLVMSYVKKFEVTDPEEAMNYYFLLRTLCDSEGRNLFLVCVSDLAIETRNYKMLFGERKSDGILYGGFFEKFNGVDFDVHAACQLTGEESVKRGMYEDAILLYDLAENYTESFRHLNILLSQVVHEPNREGSLRERLSCIADDMYNRLRTNRFECDSQISFNFNLLFTMMRFFNYYHENKYQAALDILSQIRLVPLSSNELDECLTNFRRLTGNTCKVFPHLLLTAMNILYEQYKLEKGNVLFVDENKDAQLKYLRDRAKCITNMAASVPYRMPGDTNKKLVQIEISMH